MDPQLHEVEESGVTEAGLPTVLRIRKFSNVEIQSAIDEALKTVPEGAHGVSVAHVNTAGASLSIVAKLGDKWSVAAAAYQPFGGKLEAGAVVKFVW